LVTTGEEDTRFTMATEDQSELDKAMAEMQSEFAGCLPPGPDDAIAEPDGADDGHGAAEGMIDLDLLARARAVVAAAASLGGLAGPDITQSPSTSPIHGAIPAKRATPASKKAKTPSPVAQRQSLASVRGGAASPAASPGGVGDDGLDLDLLARARAMCAAAAALEGSPAPAPAPLRIATEPAAGGSGAGGDEGRGVEAHPDWRRLPGTFAVFQGSSYVTT